MRALALLLCAGALLAQRPADVRPGMTAAQVKAALGEPTAISRQLVAHRALEQWTYAGPTPLRVTFDCRRGKPPVVEAVVRGTR